MSSHNGQAPHEVSASGLIAGEWLAAANGKRDVVWIHVEGMSTPRAATSARSATSAESDWAGLAQRATPLGDWEARCAWPRHGVKVVCGGEEVWVGLGEWATGEEA